MKVVYLFDIEGWALHDIGKWLGNVLGPHGVSVTCMPETAWHAAPTQCDVLYASFSGIVRRGFDYRRWAARIVTTIHDPCEISHFQDRMEWDRWPMRPLPLDSVDALSVISDQLATAVHRGYGVDPTRLVTWPSRGAAIRERGALRVPDGQLRLFASTNADAYVGWYVVRKRLRRWREFAADQHGDFSLRQLAAIPVRRQRKNIPLLRRVADEASRLRNATIDLALGPSGVRSRDEYEDALHRATVYACTSTMEGGPLPVMEAVLSGAAVVSTPVGQVGEWVEHGRSGWICRSFRDFQRALREYARNPDTLIEHQRAAMEVARRKSEPSVAAWHTFVTGRPAGSQFQAGSG